MSGTVDIFQVLGRADSTAIELLLSAAPDPVVARLIQIAPGHVRGRLFGGIDRDRMENSIRALMERESNADPEKDTIVKQAMGKFLQDLMQAGRIKRDGDFYLGA